MRNTSTHFVRSDDGIHIPKEYGSRSDNGVYYPEGYRRPVPRRLEVPEGFNPRALNRRKHPRVIIAGMMENRSFHHLVGGLNDHFGPQFRGVNHPDPAKGCWRQDAQTGQWIAGNPDMDGNWIQALPTTERQVAINPEHSYQDSMWQLDHIKQGNNMGFVSNFQKHYPEATRQELEFIMAYFQEDFLRAYHTLAKHGVLFDAWHASFRGPTWPNRWMHLAGTCNGYGNMPGGSVLTPESYEHWFKLENETIFTRLRDAGIPFRVYYHDTPISLLLRKHHDPSILAHYFPIEQLWEDLKKHPDELPYLMYFEPCYQGAFENDGHPPQDIWKTDWFIAKLYNAVRANQELWEVVAMLFMWDEHGGFFDDVNPPVCVQPDDQQHEDPCIQLGLRVPTLLVSPLIPHGYDPQLYENCSWLTFMLESLGLPTLTNRTAHANSFAHLFEMEMDEEPGDPWPLHIDYAAEELVAPDLQLEAETAEQINHLHAAYMHAPQYFALYRLPRIATAAIRRWDALKLWIKARNRKVRRQEAEVFHIPGVGTYTNGQDGVECYQTAVDQTRRLIARARRQHELALKQAAKKSSVNAATGETETRAI